MSEVTETGKSNREIHQLAAILLLPFRAEIPPGVVSGTLPGDSWETAFRIEYKPTYDLDPTGQGRYVAQTSNFTFLTIVTGFPFSGNLEAFAEWVTKHAPLVVSDHLLPRVNHFFLRIKALLPDAFYTGDIRNLGEVDLVFSNLIVNNEVVASRGTSTFFGTWAWENVSPLDLSQVDLTIGTAEEWQIIIRAVDFVNHGFFLEAFVVSFSLLDAVIQDFVGARIPNLGAQEGREFLRKIERRRLGTYLGTLLRVTTGSSPLDDPGVNRHVRWLNERRNELMHGGAFCTRQDAQRALRVIFWLLWDLKVRGAPLDLPESLPFWTD